MLRAVRVASLVLLALSVAQGVASRPADVVPSFTEGSSTAVGLRPGMTFTEEGLSIRVPPRGMSVAAEAIRAKGKALEVALETRDDGSVVVHRGAAAERVAMVGGSKATAIACGDGAYTLAGTRWDKTFVWYLSTKHFPSNISAGTAEKKFRESVTNIVHAFNNCGREDRVGATARYGGRTGSSPDISDRAACQSGDGRSELGFKSLSVNYLAYSCRFWGGNVYVEADSVLNTRYKWYSSKPSNCYWRWSIENVATHELGHIFGLSHVGESGHSRLTMSPVVYPCQNRESTLGLGDLKGLEALY